MMNSLTVIAKVFSNCVDIFAEKKKKKKKKKKTWVAFAAMQNLPTFFQQKYQDVHLLYFKMRLR